MMSMRLRRVTWLATLAAASLALPMGVCAAMSSARAEPTRAAGSRPSAPAQFALPRPRPHSEPVPQAESGADDLAHAAELPENFRTLAREPGEPQIPGLTIVYLHPLGLPADAVKCDDCMPDNQEIQIQQCSGARHWRDPESGHH